MKPFLRICEWKVLVENQVDKKVKALRTDNGLEFCNHAFDEFCRKFGIKRHRTCTYTPQQNGVAERMNRTIMEKVRCLLNESGLSEAFWAEAAMTSVYVINCSPSSTIEFKTPEEVWLGRKPGYGHMRKFGAVAYVHHDRGKLQPRAVKGVFIGYPPGTKGYKIWLLEEQKCVISRNVKFNEAQVYKDTVGETSGSIGDTQINKVSEIDEQETSETPPSSADHGGVTPDQELGGASDDQFDEEDHQGSSPEPSPSPANDEGSSLKNYQVTRDRK
ncbi:unnamed protein product, partial [Microthlaspi erraticum]